MSYSSSRRCRWVTSTRRPSSASRLSPNHLSRLLAAFLPHGTPSIFLSSRARALLIDLHGSLIQLSWRTTGRRSSAVWQQVLTYGSAAAVHSQRGGEFSILHLSSRYSRILFADQHPSPVGRLPSVRLDGARIETLRVQLARAPRPA